MRTLLLLMLLGLPLSAGAQERGKDQPKSAEKKTVIDFEEDTIEGDLKRPDGEYVESRRRVDQTSLIKIRENWREKVMQSSGDL